jgi:hypothetical protein
MVVTINNRRVQFETIPLKCKQKNIVDIFAKKNNRTLGQTFGHRRYSALERRLAVEYRDHLDKSLGDFLRYLKYNGDDNYRLFLNPYGDQNFCEFEIEDNLLDKGIYCFIEGETVKYVGRCKDNFKKRINLGYGKIHPKNCFIDGQSTNCRVNAKINSAGNVNLGIYRMKDDEEIADLERGILAHGNYEWNIQ